MAYSRLLLMLIGVISSHMPQVQAAPTDFWCRTQARKIMEKGTIEDLKSHMKDCVSPDMMSSPVKLPCVWVNVAEWANKTLHQKRAEVAVTLQMFQSEMQKARNQTTCQASFFKKMEHYIENYLGIINRVHIQSDMVTSSPPVVQTCNQTSLKKMLEQYRKLLQGKLNYLAQDLQENICQREHGTT